jgi:hypothetical protein
MVLQEEQTMIRKNLVWLLAVVLQAARMFLHAGSPSGLFGLNGYGE